MKSFVCGLFALALCGCKFFVPAYDNPDSERYEKEKEKAEKQESSAGTVQPDPTTGSRWLNK